MKMTSQIQPPLLNFKSGIHIVTLSHCTFSSNLFHEHIVQKYIDQMSPPENKQCCPGKVFGIKPPSNLATFEQERPQRPRCEAASTLRWLKNDIVYFFKITACHFWAAVMLRQSRIQASRASPAQKSRGLRVVLFQKLFQGYIFCFLGDSFG